MVNIEDEANLEIDADDGLLYTKSSIDIFKLLNITYDGNLAFCNLQLNN